MTSTQESIGYLLRSRAGHLENHIGIGMPTPLNLGKLSTLEQCIARFRAKPDNYKAVISVDENGATSKISLPAKQATTIEVEAMRDTDQNEPQDAQADDSGVNNTETVEPNSGAIKPISEPNAQATASTTPDTATKVVQFTVITYNDDIGKRFYIDSEGKLEKEILASRSNGTARTRSVSSIEELKHVVTNTTERDIIVSGVGEKETAVVVSKKARKDGEIARCNEDLQHRDAAGLMVFDNDYPIRVGDDDQIDVYVGVTPALAKASYVVTSSSSAYIYDKATGELLKGAGGQHYLIPVQDATDIPRAMEAEHKRLILAGHGKTKISTTGRVFVRSQVDLALRSSCQPVFQRSQMGIGLEQRKAEHINSHKGETFLFDTTQIPDLTPEEQARLAEIENSLKASVAEKAAATAEQWIIKNAPEIAERCKAAPEAVQANLRASLARGAITGNYDIYPGLQIQFADGFVDVSEVFADPQKYDGEPCADPFEPERGVGVAMFFANGGKPTINSFAHGGQVFFLHASIDQKVSRTYDEIMVDVAALDPDSPTECIEDLVKEALSLSPFDHKRVHKQIKKNTGLTLADLKSFEDEYREEIGDVPEKVDHLDLAKKVVDSIGRENVITGSEGTYIWGRGLWQRQDDRATKYLVQQSLSAKHTEIYKAVVDGVADVFRTFTYLPNHQFDVGPPETVNCANGEVSLVNGVWTLSEPKREHYRTTQIPVAFDSSATAPLFTNFLEQVFAGDEDCAEKCRALLEMMGYTLMSHCRHERFIILIGRGANGKSVFLSLLESLVGHINVAGVQPSQLERSFMRATLLSKLANIVTEIKQGEIIDDASLKGITSGETTTVEVKYGHPFTMRPYVTCWFGTNHMPHTRDFSDALFRRALVINFNNKFTQELGNADPHLPAKLKTELSGILNLALNAYAEALTKGFTMPDSCRKARDDWRKEADQVAQFVDDQCLVMGGLQEPITKLYTAYRSWCEVNGIQKGLTVKSFRDRLDKLSFGHSRTNSGRFVTGLQLNSTSAEYLLNKGK